MDEKHVAKSLSVWGGLLTLAVAFGLVQQDELAAFTEGGSQVILAGGAFAAGIATLVGRWRARSRLTFRRR